MEPENDDEEYFTLLQDQCVFGAGISKKKINFVASSNLSTSNAPQRPATNSTASDIYLSIVLGNKGIEKSQDAEVSSIETTSTTATPTPTLPEVGYNEQAICPICNLSISSSTSASATLISRPHESSLVHQICLQHSHPPSHLDRSRPGLKYLESYGWDPDSRKGLGPTGEGRRAPIRVVEKRDTIGLGVKLGKGEKVVKEPVRKLDAKKVRKMEIEGRKRGERLREMFYIRDDVERYLGGG
ncbi:MAG: hypothetical protein MMC33_008182 [Icmadophila ericetorum]|nr:hypothetical protein [Icmadophila ericetorum]